MAEAEVEERPPNPRFFCHKCSVEFDHASPEYTCPHCMGGFIEELEGNADGSDEMIDVDDDDEQYSPPPWGNEFNAFLVDLERRTSRPRFVHDPARRRRYASVQPRHRISRPRALAARLSGLRHQTPFENLIQDFILNLGVGWGGPNQVTGNMLFLGNPGDYAWGREGLDAIVTQLLNQMDGTGPPPLSKEVIEAIPTVAITQEQVDAKVQCSVCWEDFVLNESVRKLPCQHVYHENCICPWLELHGTCPICRQNLSPGGESAQNPDGRNNPNNTGNFTTLHEFFQAVHDTGSNHSSSVSSGSYTARTSSDSASSSSSSSSGASSDRYTTGSSSSDCNTDLEFN